MMVDLINLKQYTVILASKSPRRNQLLNNMGILFQVMTKDTEEIIPQNLEAAMVAQYLSQQKSEQFQNNELPSNFLLITADTTVLCGETILGKPKTHDEAFKMLKSLSGHTHQVITGVTVRSANKINSFSAHSDVTFEEMSDALIEHYIDTYKPYDKAGAYGIQEWIGHIAISNVSGSFYNVMGLPTHKLYHVLQEFSAD